MAITFCGHREVYDNGRIEKWLYNTCKHLILSGERCFFLGGYGAFDNMALRVLTRLKMEYNDICRILVIPYISSRISSEIYDASVYPPLESIPKRLAILKRNEWMVDKSDTLVAYVLHGWGGAAKTLAYAEKRGKTIIRYMPEHEKDSTR